MQMQGAPQLEQLLRALLALLALFALLVLALSALNQRCRLAAAFVGLAKACYSSRVAVPTWQRGKSNEARVADTILAASTAQGGAGDFMGICDN